MPAQFTTDPNLGAGYGIITVPEIHCETQPSFALYRASDGLCLTPTGWQNAEIFLQPNNWDCDTNALRLSVDASIVDHLDALDTYKILIKHDTNDAIAQPLIIQDIVYSSMHGGQGLGLIEEKDIHSTEPKTLPEPLPEPKVEEPMQVEEPVQVEEPLPEIIPVQKKSSLPIILLILLILLLIGAGLWWYFQNQGQINQEAENQSETSQVETETTPETKPEPPLQSEEQEKPAVENSNDVEQNQPKTELDEDSSNANAPSLSPMQQAREFLRGDSQGQASLDLAQKLSEEQQAESSAESHDAIFLLFEDAAQKNIPAAMLALAQFYDPSSTKPKGSIEVDPNEAYTWYNKALAAGISDAQSHLDRLKDWATEASKSGDKIASDLLNKWK